MNAVLPGTTIQGTHSMLSAAKIHKKSNLQAKMNKKKQIRQKKVARHRRGDTPVARKQHLVNPINPKT